MLTKIFHTVNCNEMFRPITTLRLYHWDLSNVSNNHHWYLSNVSNFQILFCIYLSSETQAAFGSLLAAPESRSRTCSKSDRCLQAPHNTASKACFKEECAGSKRVQRWIVNNKPRVISVPYNSFKYKLLKIHNVKLIANWIIRQNNIF